MIPFQSNSKIPREVKREITPNNLPAPIVGKNILAEVPEESVWLANYISKQTKATYKNAVKDFIGFHGIASAEELRGIRQAHMIAWRDRLIELGHSERTVTNRLSAVSSLFAHLCDKQLVPTNPVNGIKRPKVDQSRVKSPLLTRQQVRRLLDAPDPNTLIGARDLAILSILAYAGCRISEVCSLRIKDYYEDGGYWVLNFRVKGGKRHVVGINRELQIALDYYLRMAPHSAELDAPMFVAVQRMELLKPLTRRAVGYLFKSYATKANLPRGTVPHSMRVTFITTALDNNAPLEKVQHTAGHASTNTTRMYDKRTFKHRDSASHQVHY